MYKSNNPLPPHLSIKIVYATLLSNSLLEIRLEEPLIDITDLKIQLRNIDTHASFIGSYQKNLSAHRLLFLLPESIEDISQHFKINLFNQSAASGWVELRYFKYYDHTDFITNYIPPSDTILGISLSESTTFFQIWSPTASAINLKLYPTGDHSEASASHPLTKNPKGLWSLTLEKNLESLYYTYEVTNWGKQHEIIDPYAIAAGVNGKRALITNMQRALAPLGNLDDSFIPIEPKDAIIYELHLRDVNLSPTTNHKEELRGKFLGLTQRGTTNKFGQTTGIDHILELGITHLHLLPLFDFNSIDESLKTPQFNWGYDPLNYNVPEGSYSSNPHDGYVRLREMRQMIYELHKMGLAVIMDVVYNHTGPVEDHTFQLLVPDYYFRMDGQGLFANGSATGNETASEREMFQRYMRHSLQHWMTHYKIDGFRFDLMAIHDIETMNLIAKDLKAINPYTLLYGEGWHGGGSPLDPAKAALKANAHLMPNIAVFNDDIRDGLKGYVFDASMKGLLTSNKNSEERTHFGYLSGLLDSSSGKYLAYTKEPSQSIAYVSAHDNHTLHDRFLASYPAKSTKEYMRLQMLANAIILTSPNIPFLHAGVEMMRTKNGDDNSYHSSDKINQLNYETKNSSKQLMQYYKNLIQLRKNHPIFMQGLLANHQHAFTRIQPELADPLFLSYHLLDHTGKDDWQAIYLIFNIGKNSHTISLNKGEWHLFADTWQVIPELEDKIYSDKVTIEAESTLLLYQKK